MLEWPYTCVRYESSKKMSTNSESCFSVTWCNINIVILINKMKVIYYYKSLYIKYQYVFPLIKWYFQELIITSIAYPAYTLYTFCVLSCTHRELLLVIYSAHLQKKTNHIKQFHRINFIRSLVIWIFSWKLVWQHIILTV